MKNFSISFRATAAVLLTGLLVVVSLLNIRDRADWSDPWDGVFWEESEGGLRASEVTGGSPAEGAGITGGERLASINGFEVRNLGQYARQLYHTGPNSSVAYVLKAEDGSVREVAFTLGSKPLLGTKDALQVVLAFLYIGIGLFVVLRGTRLPRSRHFYFMCLAAFVMFSFSWTPRWGPLDKTVYALDVLAFLLLPALFLHFCMRFTAELPSGRSRVPILYLPAAFLGLAHGLWLAGRLAPIGLARTAHGSEVLDRIQLVYFCASFIAAGVLLWKRRSSSPQLVTRQQMKWVSYGALAGIMPFSLIYAIPVLLGVRANFAMESSMLSLALIPLSFAYAIVRFRLLDVEILFRRGAAYFMASSMLLAVYLFFVLVMGRALEKLAPEVDFVLICAGALAIALLFAPLRDAIQSRLDRYFYKDRFDDRASLLGFARMLTTEISLGRLSRRVLEKLSKAFQIEKAALFLADPVRPGWYRLTDEIGLEITDDFETLLFTEDQLLGEGNEEGLPDVGANRLHRAGAKLQHQGLFYLQDLTLRSRRVGMIGLGQLPRDQHFSSEDLDLLAALSGYAAIALENANLYRSVEIKALELERLKIYTENILESINVAVLALDLEGRITSCNRAFEDLYHVRRDEILGSSVDALFSGDVIESLQKAAGTTGWELKGASSIFKLYMENRRRESLIVNVSTIPMMDATDQVGGCVIVLDDITMKTRLEDQLLQAEKLSSLGLLAAGIAHEVNTPITGISSYTQMLLKDLPETDSRKAVLEKIERQTFRAAEIVNGLLNFARMNGSEFRDLDINQLIQETLSLLDHQFRQCHITVDSLLDRSLPLVYGNSGKLQQVFINLLLNARDAMPSGGTLRIRTHMNDSMVLVDIRDSGVGITPENIKRIYDPFFTTKTTEKGTGLGLAVTYGIVQEHGGRIFVDSTLGRGTEFRLKLPTRQALSA